VPAGGAGRRVNRSCGGRGRAARTAAVHVAEMPISPWPTKPACGVTRRWLAVPSWSGYGGREAPGRKLGSKSCLGAYPLVMMLQVAVPPRPYRKTVSSPVRCSGLCVRH